MAKNMIIKIKPCPWCGGAPTLIKEPISGYKDCFMYKMACSICKSEAPNGRFYTIDKSDGKAKENAITVWNKRAEGE